MGDAVGEWSDRIESINSLVDDLSQPTVDMARVIGAVAKGDLSQSVPFEVAGRPLQGEYLRTAKLVNGMVEQLAGFFRRSHPRRARSRHGRKTRRSGAGQTCLRRVA